MGIFRDHATEIKVKVAASVIAGLLVSSILAIVSFVPGIVPALWAWLSKVNPAQVLYREPEPAISSPPKSQPLPEVASQSGPGMLSVVRSPFSVFEMGGEFQERRNIRDYNKVLEVPADKSGFVVGSLPRGVFGFVDQRLLITHLPEKNDAAKEVALNNIPLRTSRYGDGDWELHLTHSGELFLLGVVGNLIEEEIERPISDMRDIFMDSTIQRTAPRSHVVAVSVARLRVINSENKGRRLHFEVIKSLP